MPLQNTSGNDTTDAYGGGVAAKVKYIENYFQTWLRTGTGASATITTGLDASTNKALVWTKSRSAATDHKLTDTVRGATKALISDTTAAQTTDANGLTAFSSTGYTIGTDTNYNNSGATYVDWEFVATPKFFDVVTYTGTGSATTIAHNLGSVPGCIIVKRTDTTGNWQVYHNGLTSAAYSIQLNLTSAQASATTVWNSTAPTSTVFSVGTDATVNASGGTYVAYIFAHNAGGFGLTGTDNVISCGSFTCDGSGAASVSLGYESQWVLVKSSSLDDGYGWLLFDTMRGFSVPGSVGDYYLRPNSSGAESAGGSSTFGGPTATGFSFSALQSSATYIYIAIRKGPMAVPTDGTTVFSPNAQTTAAPTTVTTNFPVDVEWWRNGRTNAGRTNYSYDRLRGNTQQLRLNTVDAEQTDVAPNTVFFDSNVAFVENLSSSGQSGIYWSFRRAPSFLDEVCYTGTGSNTTQTHNLNAVPELIIVKKRNAASTTGWLVGATTLGYSNKLYLNLTNASAADSTAWNSTAPTSTVFSLGTNTDSNASAATYVAYLFATCAGVSKVGSYTGNGTTQAIACGFTGGARFVLIKRTDSTGDWYVYDTARGMTSVTDPYLLINSTAAEVATLGSVTSTTGGFTVNAAILAAINTSSATYIFLAIA